MRPVGADLANIIAIGPNSGPSPVTASKTAQGLRFKNLFETKSIARTSGTSDNSAGWVEEGTTEIGYDYIQTSGGTLTKDYAEVFFPNGRKVKLDLRGVAV